MARHLFGGVIHEGGHGSVLIEPHYQVRGFSITKGGPAVLAGGPGTLAILNTGAPGLAKHFLDIRTGGFPDLDLVPVFRARPGRRQANNVHDELINKGIPQENIYIEDEQQVIRVMIPTEVREEIEEIFDRHGVTY